MFHFRVTRVHVPMKSRPSRVPGCHSTWHFLLQCFSPNGDTAKTTSFCIFLLHEKPTSGRYPVLIHSNSVSLTRIQHEHNRQAPSYLMDLCLEMFICLTTIVDRSTSFLFRKSCLLTTPTQPRTYRERTCGKLPFNSCRICSTKIIDPPLHQAASLRDRY